MFVVHGALFFRMYMYHQVESNYDEIDCMRWGDIVIDDWVCGPQGMGWCFEI